MENLFNAPADGELEAEDKGNEDQQPPASAQPAGSEEDFSHGYQYVACLDFVLSNKIPGILKDAKSSASPPRSPS
jgi:hypothetical protein